MQSRFQVFVAAIPLVFGLLCTPATAGTEYEAIDLSGFADVIKHWDDRTAEQNQNLYPANEIRGIADNLLLFQRDNGGWPTNKHPLRILTADETRAALKQKAATDTSFDNRNIYPQIEYLAAAYKQTQDKRYLNASLKGLEFILEHQYENGGFSHSPPRTDAYYGHITFADEVMPGVLGLLRDVASGTAPFDVFDKSVRKRAEKALLRGDALVLDLQVQQSGKPTVWAGQYDRKTLQPVQARSFELPALQSWESVSVVRYLMSIPNPSPEVVRAVEGAIEWFNAVQIGGMKLQKIQTEDIRFDYHTSTYDLQVVADPAAPALWARFYELNTNQPFLANRDGSKVYTLADIKLERRTGYNWYGNWPQELIDKEYVLWRQRLDR